MFKVIIIFVDQVIIHFWVMVDVYVNTSIFYVSKLIASKQ